VSGGGVVTGVSVTLTSRHTRWNYDHLAALWKYESWLPESAVELARAHYSAYMVKRQDGLRIITLNGDMWYRSTYPPGPLLMPWDGFCIVPQRADVVFV
jgi:hypothetical protein